MVRWETEVKFVQICSKRSVVNILKSNPDGVQILSTVQTWTEAVEPPGLKFGQFDKRPETIPPSHFLNIYHKKPILAKCFKGFVTGYS